MTKIKNEPGVIVALDMLDIDEVFSIVHDINHAKGNFVFKVGRLIEMKYGINVISQIRDATKLPIIYDGKIADIPYISALIAEGAYDAGADAVIMHSFVGEDVVEAVVDLNKGDVITVIEMSHPGWDINLFPYTSVYSMNRLGVNGVVLPATTPKLIRGVSEILDNEMYIISPGIGIQGANIGDAFSAGATYEIIGRKIYNDKDPLVSAEYCYGWAQCWERRCVMDK